MFLLCINIVFYLPTRRPIAIEIVFWARNIPLFQHSACVCVLAGENAARYIFVDGITIMRNSVVFADDIRLCHSLTCVITLLAESQFRPQTVLFLFISLFLPYLSFRPYLSPLLSLYNKNIFPSIYSITI